MKPYEDEYRVVWPDGTIHWLAGSGRVLRDETGKPTRMSGVIIDITEWKQAEAEHRRLATIVIDSNDAVTVQDFEGRLTAWNRGAEQMYGYSESEALSMNIRDIVPENRRDEALELVERIARDEDVQSLETQRISKDGRTLDVWLTVTKLVDDAGNPVAVATTERDVTERKQLQQQLAKLTEQERQRIGRELHDTTGQELTGLGFMAQSVLEQLAAESHPGEETVRKMEESIQRALAQVRRFAQGLVPVELDADGLMAALQELAIKTTEACNIACTFRRDQPVSMEDNTMATQIYLIAKEAVANAVKHAQAEHVEIELSRYDNRIMLLVRDDGVGIGEASEEDGMGLRIMRHRAGLIQATLEIEPVDKGGTLVMCVLTT